MKDALEAPRGPAPSGEPSRWARIAPGLAALAGYRRAWLRDDLVAGLVVSTVLVPAGMSYAEASGLPAITGLYATIIPLLAYAVFGPSRVMVLGPDSGLAALIAASILACGGTEEPARAVALAGALSIISGVTGIGLGVLRFGFITDLLSKPVRVGYTNGIALTVLVTQLPKLCGFGVRAGSVPEVGLAFARGLLAGETRLPALAVGAGSLALILGLRKLAPRVPGVLLAVVGSTLVVAATGLAEKISVVGPVPRGIPSPSIPSVSAADWSQLVVAGVGIAVVAFANTTMLSRTVAARQGYRVDPNQELVALGAANLAAGLFGGFPVSSSSSRTPVAESAGSRTQLTGVVGAAVIGVLLVFAPNLVRDLPTAALAAVVISAALRLLDFEALALFWRARRSDLVLTSIGFSAVALLGVISGIAVTVAVSLLDFFRRAWRPHDAVLGRADGVKGYHDVTRYPGAKQVPGLLLYRWDAPLFFANADTFRTRVLAEIERAGERVRRVVVAAEPITDVDSTAAEMLEELRAELELRAVELAFAEMKDPVKDRLVRYGLVDKLGKAAFSPTLGVAVHAFLEQHPAPWTDWEDGAAPSPAPAPERA